MAQPTQTVLLTLAAPPAAPPAPLGNVQWRHFLRALAEEVDARATPSERDGLLRAIGHRLSHLMPLPPVATLEALQIEMNDALAAMGWGEVLLEVDEAAPALNVTHQGLPRIGSLGAPAGQWLAGVLPGLYDGWFGQQPGSQGALRSERVMDGAGPGVVVRYVRGLPT